MRRHLWLLLILFPLLSWSQLSDAHLEVERTRGFSLHKKEKAQITSGREQGLPLHLEQIELEKREYSQAREEYRKQKKTTRPLEETPFYREYVEQKSTQRRQRQEALEDFNKDKAEQKRLLIQANLDPMEELGLPETRPRFEIRRRALYGGGSTFGKGSSSGSSGFGGSSGPSYTPPDNTFMPPSGFDDFPQPPEDFDLPPPPPLPPFDGDISIPSDEFYPPPPPPPMPIEDYQF